MPVTGILSGIKAATAKATGLPGKFVDEVELRLQSLGYALQESDPWAVCFAIQSAAGRIKDGCNTAAVPAGLAQVAVNMACGEFLLAKKAGGELEGFSIDLNSAALKQLQEGDTSASFATDGMKSPEQRLDAIIDYLINSGKARFGAYRRLKWT